MFGDVWCMSWCIFHPESVEACSQHQSVGKILMVKVCTFAVDIC